MERPCNHTVKQSWDYYYSTGLILISIGLMSLTLALPIAVVFFYYRIVAIIWLIFPLALITCAGVIFQKYGLYKKYQKEWEVQMILANAIHNELCQKDYNGMNGTDYENDNQSRP